MKFQSILLSAFILTNSGIASASLVNLTEAVKMGDVGTKSYCSGELLTGEHCPMSLAAAESYCKKYYKGLPTMLDLAQSLNPAGVSFADASQLGEDYLTYTFSDMNHYPKNPVKFSYNSKTFNPNLINLNYPTRERVNANRGALQAPLQGMELFWSNSIIEKAIDSSGNDVDTNRGSGFYNWVGFSFWADPNFSGEFLKSQGPAYVMCVQ